MQLRAGCAGPGCAGFGGLHGKQKLYCILRTVLDLKGPHLKPHFHPN
jgi:hypothetical protein